MKNKRGRPLGGSELQKSRFHWRWILQQQAGETTIDKLSGLLVDRSVREAAAFLGCCEKTFKTLMKQTGIRAREVRKPKRVSAPAMWRAPGSDRTINYWEELQRFYSLFAPPEIVIAYLRKNPVYTTGELRATLKMLKEENDAEDV